MKRFLTILILFSLPALVFAQSVGGTTRFGMIGVALGETLRLNVVAFPPVPCIAQLSFVNANGVPNNGSGQPANGLPGNGQPGNGVPVNLQPGQSAFLDFNANTALTQFGQRIALRPAVTLTQDVGPNACHATAEVFDNFTGFSLLALQPQPDPGLTLQPQPNPGLGMVGIALGQVLRLNVVAFPPVPCFAQLGFVNNSGTPPFPSKTVTLQPGQADFLDVSAASLGIGFGHRAELSPVASVMPGPNAAPSVCLANAEVFDSFSGRTTAWLPGTPAQ
jgi:hypothetical protein